MFFFYVPAISRPSGAVPARRTSVFAQPKPRPGRALPDRAVSITGPPQKRSFCGARRRAGIQKRLQTSALQQTLHPTNRFSATAILPHPPSFCNICSIFYQRNPARKKKTEGAKRKRGLGENLRFSPVDLPEANQENGIIFGRACTCRKYPDPSALGAFTSPQTGGGGCKGGACSPFIPAVRCPPWTAVCWGKEGTASPL